MKIYDPTNPLGRSQQLQDSIQATLDQAAIARASEPRTAAETALLNALMGIPRHEISVQAARLKVIEDARLAEIAAIAARIPADTA